MLTLPTSQLTISWWTDQLLNIFYSNLKAEMVFEGLENPLLTAIFSPKPRLWELLPDSTNVSRHALFGSGNLPNSLIFP
jgi:hypothetical protein